MAILDQIVTSKLWTPLGVLITIISSCLFLHFRTKKRITFGVYGFTVLLTNTLANADKFRLYYNDQVLDNIILLMLRVTNTGNRCLLATDYVRPIAFSFVESMSILSFEVTSTRPRNIHPIIEADQNKLTFEPIDLNAGDDIWVQLVLSSDKGDYSELNIVTPDIRIKNVNQVRIYKSRKPDTLITNTLGMSLPFLGLALIYNAIFFNNSNLTMLLIGVFLTVVGIPVFNITNSDTKPYDI